VCPENVPVKASEYAADKLHIVAHHSSIVSHVLYSLPSWGGIRSVELVGRINALLQCLERFWLLTAYGNIRPMSDTQ